MRDGRWVCAAALALMPTSAAAQHGAPPRFASPSQVAGQLACEDLSALRVPDLRIERATAVSPAPSWTIPHPRPQDPAHELGVPFCRVEAIAEDEIRFEVWLPEHVAWNGRILGTGNGGFAGFLRYDGLAHGVQRGFATLSTDTGHRQEQRHWAIGYPRRLENYGHRGQHLALVNARQIVTAFYGAGPHHSYFMGCSGGGMQAMNEVQRYPADYDGVIAGAHGRSIVGISARWLLSALVGNGTADARLAPEDWTAIARAGVARCDADDGLADGVIADPRSCRFAPAETPGLSPDKARTAERILGAIIAPDGAVLFEGYHPGVDFPALDDPGRAGDVFAEWLHQDPSWNPATFDSARDIPLAENAVPGSAFRNPDLSAFARRGGKLISYHGWDDGVVPGEATLAYYHSVQRYLGDADTQAFYRLYMVPGMAHCSGGAGADVFGQSFLRDRPDGPSADNDLLLAMVRWVEQGQAPDRLEAARLSGGQVEFTRPLCPFPTVARFSGAGDPQTAESFVCEQP